MSLRTLLHGLGRLAGLGTSPAPPDHALPGTRVRLRTPLASRERVWIPEGAVGIVVASDTRTRRVSLELDAPRTVVTVPWSWVEAARPAGQSGPTP